SPRRILVNFGIGAAHSGNPRTGAQKTAAPLQRDSFREWYCWTRISAERCDGLPLAPSRPGCSRPSETECALLSLRGVDGRRSRPRGSCEYACKPDGALSSETLRLHFENPRNDRRGLLPVALLGVEQLVSDAGQAINPGPPIVLRSCPIGGNRSF